jgi:DNA-directed RNA polymerase subunit RPC12/RpoP
MRKSTARMPVETKCLKCGKGVCLTLGDFKSKRTPVCPDCGGKLDTEPLRKMALKAVKDLKAALEADSKARGHK